MMPVKWFISSLKLKQAIASGRAVLNEERLHKGEAPLPEPAPCPSHRPDSEPRR